MDGFGSGFVVEPTGLIVTNRHVIEDATEVRVAFRDGTVVPAKPVSPGCRSTSRCSRWTPANRCPP